MNRTKPSNAVRPDGQTSSRWRSDRTRSTALLNHCRELASSTLIEALPAIMDKLDDAMFDLANRSDDNQQRSVYFESMRHVRVKRAGIETEFRRVFKESVQATLERLADSNEASGFSDVSSEDLDLVGEDDLEETLAVTNMVRKIRTNCKQPLYALDRRIAELLKVDEIEPENNPFGPETMCNAFKDACDQIDVDVEVRLVILKLFDQHIGAQLERLYCEINDYLVAEAVLPAIRHNVKAQPNVAQEPGAESSAGPAPDTPAPPPIQHDQPAIAQPVHVASTNAGLLDALRQIMDVNFVTRNAAHPPSEGQLWLVGQLTHLQQGDSQGACEDLASLDVSGVRTGTVNVLRDLKRPTVVNGIGEIDAMMFDVVAMMFDFILDDKKMPAPMKALIGRLQIPMLKVAILDKAFFARKFRGSGSQRRLIRETGSDGRACHRRVRRTRRGVCRGPRGAREISRTGRNRGREQRKRLCRRHSGPRASQACANQGGGTNPALSWSARALRRRRGFSHQSLEGAAFRPLLRGGRHG
jgi:hypothetical protein